MKILLVHNHYGSDAPSGENLVFDLERSMLERHGHEVQTFERHSDEIRNQGALGLLRGATVTPWNFSAARAMRKTVSQFLPDVIHAHNTFPLISPAVFSAARGVGRVMTLHNYRLFCPAAIMMRNGNICTECIDGQSVLPALRHSCYRGSRMATLPLAANIALHRVRRTWERDVEAFIALTSFQRDYLVRSGLCSARVWVKPNFRIGNPDVTPFEQRDNRVVFVGRLSSEKGVDDLLDAWLAWGDSAPELRLIGDGPLREALAARAKKANNIKFCGQLTSDETQREIGSARLLVMPSRWFETFGMALIEAMSAGTPVLVANIGSLPATVSGASGETFEVGNPVDLRETVAELWADEARLRFMARASRMSFESDFSENSNYKMLMNIYSHAIDIARTK